MVTKFPHFLRLNVHIAMIAACLHSLQVNGDVMTIRTFFPVPIVQKSRQDDYKVSPFPTGK
jgi:hypothetical protein